MKVLHLGQMIGGINVYIRNSTTALSDMVEFVVVSGKEDNNAPIQIGERSVKEYKIDLYREISLRDISGLRQAIKIIRQEKPDVIHCHSAKGGMIGRIAGRWCGVPTVYTPHAFSFLSTLSPLKRKIYIFLEKITKARAYLAACSRSEQELAIKQVKYKSSKALVWSNSVPDSAKDFARTINQGEEFNICTVGRPCYQKNIQLLVEVAAQVTKKIPAAKFTLLGVGHYSPELEQIKSLIAEYSLENNFTLVDWCAQKQMFEYFKRADLYLTTSRYEGLPLSVIEAAAHSCPILATSVLGNIDCVEHGINGYLLEPKAEVFTEKIIEFYNNRESLEQMSKASRELFLNEFFLDNQISKLAEIYQKIKKS